MKKSLLLLTIATLSIPTSLCGQESVSLMGGTLPGTAPLELTKPLHEVMVQGISLFAERELAKAREQRTASWVSESDREASRVAARKRLREYIGAVDPLTDSDESWISVQSADQISIFSDDGVVLAQGHQLKIPVTEGITCETQFFRGSNQDGNDAPVADRPVFVLLADPHLIAQDHWELPVSIARRGGTVACPVLVDRNTEFSMHPEIRQTNMPHREYLYRLGFNMGRHIVGYEVERTLALINRLHQQLSGNGGEPKIIVVGLGEGGLIAELVAALAPQQIDAAVICGYFGPRENVWQEPIDHNIWSQLTEFGDAELASLMGPTPLIIEAGELPEISGQPAAKQGQAAIAAPGIIRSPQLEAVQKEFQRAQKYDQQEQISNRLHLVGSPEGILSSSTIKLLNESCKLHLKTDLPSVIVAETEQVGLETTLRLQQKRLIGELVRHTQMLLARSDKVRAKLWKDVDRSSVEAWTKQAPEYRDMVYNSFIGKLAEKPAAFNPRTRKIIDEPTHAGYEVVLDLYPTPTWSEDDPGVIAGGILLLPKNLQKGERRPVVVCQHGLEGIPMDTITLDTSLRAYRAYKGFATQLVQQGFIVYAPQNPYKGFDNFRVIQRKSNPLGRSLFSYIIPQHRQTISWLSGLDYVDPQRIAFYGLSYGGKTAVRVPPLLPPEGDFPGYCLSICSADFNEWIRKNASAEDRYSYIYTPEYEIFEWNMGHIANYAELSWLMAPRPFMVERGHDDGVAPDEWVGWEFAKVRRHYTKLGITDQTEIEWFDGPHSINGKGTFEFLHKHLDWPVAPK